MAISRENGIGGIKLKVGQPNTAEDIRRLTAVREVLGDDFPLMVDANQQWDRETAIRMGRKMEPFNLIWIEEPLDAYDVEGHAQLAAALDTPIATGEMLTSFREHEQLILGNASDFRATGRPARRWDLPVPENNGSGREHWSQTGSALCHGGAPASRRRLPAGAMAGALPSG